MGEYAAKYGKVMNGAASPHALAVYNVMAENFTGYWSGTIDFAGPKTLNDTEHEKNALFADIVGTEGGLFDGNATVGPDISQPLKKESTHQDNGYIRAANAAYPDGHVERQPAKTASLGGRRMLGPAVGTGIEFLAAAIRLLTF